MIWSQVFHLKNFKGWDGKVKFRNGSEEAYEIFKYLMVLRFLNNPNGLILDLIFSKWFNV